MRRIPSYRLHKSTGQAVVTLSGHDHYLGPHGSPESHAAYQRVVAEWLSRNRQPETERTPDLTVSELLTAYMAFALVYYRKADPDSGELVETSQVGRLRYALAPVRQLYGDTPARAFGPLALKAVQAHLVGRGLCRKYVNQLVDSVKRVWKWAVSEQLVPAGCYEALRCVPGLRAGRTQARESVRVLPAPADAIPPVKALLSRHLAACVDLQLYTGCRPGEALAIRPREVDRSADVWLYRPGDHKTLHHQHERVILIGPRAQAVLAPFLLRPDNVYCFVPREAVEEQYRERGYSCKGLAGRYPHPRYQPATYAQQVRNACRRAGVAPWHPHQLRHNAATELVAAFGWAVAQTVLGHATLSATRIYGESDLKAAMEAIRKVG